MFNFTTIIKRIIVTIFIFINHKKISSFHQEWQRPSQPLYASYNLHFYYHFSFFFFNFYYHFSCKRMSYVLPAEKYFLNVVHLNPIRITITLFRLIWYQMEFRLMPYQSKAVIIIQIWMGWTRFKVCQGSKFMFFYRNQLIINLYCLT